MDKSRYTCPGQKHPISRAVHLGRLAAFYPACRQCPHRDDTGTLSPRQVEQLQKVQSANPPRSPFHDEGAGGVYLNDFTSADARHIAAAFGAAIRDEGRGLGTSVPSQVGYSSNPQSLIPNPSVILAGDGRTISAEPSAAVAEGLRWAGCDAIDIGPATAACLAFAIHTLGSSGGVLVGNPGRQPQVVGLQFWDAGPRPLSAGGALDRIAERYLAAQGGQSHFRGESVAPRWGGSLTATPTVAAKIGTVPRSDTSARNYGSLCRMQADAQYLAALQRHYHALRPLRVVVDSGSRPLVEYLRKLAATVACQIIPSRVARRELPEQVRADAAHFAVCVDGDGETCCALDERGSLVPTERLLLLLAREALLSLPDVKPRPVVAVEQSTSSEIVARIEALGGRVIGGGARRAEMAAAIGEHGAVLGGGPSGRFWFADLGAPLPDALMAITRLLVILSRGDQPLSAILDREVPWG